MKKWIDPPSGHRYGFPKVYDDESGETLAEWLVKEGYPEDRAEDIAFTRAWDYTEEGE